MDTDDFATLSTEFETLTRKLKESQDAGTRKRLLGQLRIILRKLDRAVLNEHTD